MFNAKVEWGVLYCLSREQECIRKLFTECILCNATEKPSTERLHCPETDLQKCSQVKVAQVALVALVAFSFEDQCSELPGEGFKVESSTTFVSTSDR